MIASLVSALKVANLLKEGEVYHVTLTAIGGEVESDSRIKEIPMVNEFEDVFKPLEGFLRQGIIRLPLILNVGRL